MNKKILISLAVVGIVSAIAVGGTVAFFSDRETSTGNTFAAGAIDLQIDSTASYNGQPVAGATWALKDLNPTSDKFFNFADIKPGDKGENTISLHVINNDAWVCAEVSNLTNFENGQTEPETSADSTTGTNDGELQNAMVWTIWRDDGDNIQESGEAVLASGQPVNGVLSVYDSTTGAGALTGGSTAYLGVSWELPLATGNEVQTDSLTGDISFEVVQSRNNTQFVCGSSQPQGPTVGANENYSTPSCDATVSGSSSIQAAINAGSAGQTICVDASYDRTGDNVAIRISKDNMKLAALNVGTLLDVPVVLDNDGTTVTGFHGTIGQAESVAEQAAFYIDGDAENATISYNTVTGGSGAAVLTESGGTNNGCLIANNVFSGATQGVYTNPHTGTITIEYNNINNNLAGLAGLMGAVARYNKFEHSTPGSEAVGIDSTFDSNVATINYNNFLDGTRINDYGAVAMINAENNFFSAGGASQTTAGHVDYTPEAATAFAQN